MWRNMKRQLFQRRGKETDNIKNFPQMALYTNRTPIKNSDKSFGDITGSFPSQAREDKTCAAINGRQHSLIGFLRLVNYEYQHLKGWQLRQLIAFTRLSLKHPILTNSTSQLSRQIFPELVTLTTKKPWKRTEKNVLRLPSHI